MGEAFAINITEDKIINFYLGHCSQLSEEGDEYYPLCSYEDLTNIIRKFFQSDISAALRNKNFFNKIHYKIKNGKDFSKPLVFCAKGTLTIKSSYLNLCKAFIISRVHKIDVRLTKSQTKLATKLGCFEDNINLDEYIECQLLVSGYQDYLLSIGESLDFPETPETEGL